MKPAVVDAHAPRPMTSTLTIFDRNHRLVARRRAHLDGCRARPCPHTTRALGREFGISQAHVVRILALEGDPLADDATKPSTELAAERDRLVQRVFADRQRIAELDDELQVRRDDDLLGLGQS